MKSLTSIVFDNVRAIRKRRGWSAAQLVERIPSEVGLTRNAIANAEIGRRDAVSVDELAALAEALGIANPWLLTRPEVPPCGTCNDVPPQGFRCLTCGTTGAS
jgi:transcriptional regulator with XRE-family HTH domain